MRLLHCLCRWARRPARSTRGGQAWGVKGREKKWRKNVLSFAKNAVDHELFLFFFLPPPCGAHYIKFYFSSTSLSVV